METVNNDNETTMNTKQLEVMKMSLNPTKKLFLLAMLEMPEASRKGLSEFMNCDATHISTVSKKLVEDGLIMIERVEETSRVKYTVNV